MKHLVNVELNNAKDYKTYNKNFKKCIGTGRADLALRKDYMDNLEIIQREIGFETIRGHGIFSDQMGCYRKSIHVDARNSFELDRPIYNFSRVVKVIDNYLSLGVKPFIELGFMPSQMAAGSETVFWWKGNVSEPRDVKLWTTMVEKLLQTLIEQYGLEEVLTWNFEVWNEPNVSFWRPTYPDKELAYYELYEVTAKTIKKVHPGLKVGGPATSVPGVEWMPRFFNYCKKNSVPLDFVSHHVYVSHNKQYSDEFIYMEFNEPKYFVKQINRAKQYMEGAGLSDLPLHITEWNTSYSCIDHVHDSSLNAAYVAWILTHADDMVTSYGYWVFSDVFEEADIPRALFHGGFGLLTENGIRKPVFHAFAFANALNEQIIHLDDYCCITKDQRGNIAALLFNPRIDILDGDPLELEINIPLAYEEGIMSVQSVDRKNGNAYEVWKIMGRPRIPNKSQMEIIKRTQYPDCKVNIIKKEKNGLAKIRTELPVNGLKLIEIMPFKDYSSDYEGLREQEIMI